MAMNRQRDPDRKQSSANPLALLVMGVGILMLLAGGFFIWQQQQVESVPEPEPVSLKIERTPIEEAPPVVEEVEELLPVFAPVPERSIVMPPASIDGSDPYVRKAIADFGPALAEWLMATQQIRKWVLAIDLMADGNLMKQDRPL